MAYSCRCRRIPRTSGGSLLPSYLDGLLALGSHRLLQLVVTGSLLVKLDISTSPSCEGLCRSNGKPPGLELAHSWKCYLCCFLPLGPGSCDISWPDGDTVVAEDRYDALRMVNGVGEG